MSQDERPRFPLLRLLSTAWRAVDASRRFATNALFLGIVVALLVAFVAGGPKVPKGSALVVKPHGELVEQLSAGAQGLLAWVTDGGQEETLLRDQLDAVRAAREDRRISAIFLDLSRMDASGLTKLEDLRGALLDFRKSGKKVIAYADAYTQSTYALAAGADEIWLHPEGAVLIEGFGRWRTYYKDGIDRLGIDWHVYRVGEYKSAAEPFIRNGPSPEALQADSRWLTNLWTNWLDGVGAARKQKPQELSAYVERMADSVESSKGRLSKIALDAKLVDRLGYRDEVRARMIELCGEDPKERTFHQVSVRDYLDFRGGDRNGESGGDAVAVVVARGDIIDGKQPPGRIGGDSTAALIRRARRDEKVKAIVLRVDSPGGSAFASEVIRRELELARRDGKKVVVSMGSLAASGGYWISTASDEIWASPSTVTGSIGVFGMFPTVDRPMARLLGMRVDGVGTTPLSGGMRFDRPLKPEVERIMRAATEHGYDVFLERVSEARKLTRDEVDRIARGRVWSGGDALERKLVDKLGGLPEAIASAAAMAKLPKDHRTWWVEEKKSFTDWVMSGLAAGQARLARLGARVEEPDPAPAPAVVRALREQLSGAARLLALSDPAGVYAYCPCDTR